jgi:hypothetical protein
VRREKLAVACVNKRVCRGEYNVMTTRLCDRCGQLIDEKALRYIAKIQVYAAYDPLNIDFGDATRDRSKEIQAVLKSCEGLSEEELMRDVYVEFQFDLCRACQRSYVQDPLSPANETE